MSFEQGATFVRIAIVCFAFLIVVGCAIKHWRDP
jgi:hypothetical protein